MTPTTPDARDPLPPLREAIAKTLWGELSDTPLEECRQHADVIIAMLDRRSPTAGSIAFPSGVTVSSDTVNSKTEAESLIAPETIKGAPPTAEGTLDAERMVEVLVRTAEALRRVARNNDGSPLDSLAAAVIQQDSAVIDNLSFCLPSLLRAEAERDALKVELGEARGTVVQVTRTLTRERSSQPGTTEAKLLSANVVLRSRLASIHDSLAALPSELMHDDSGAQCRFIDRSAALALTRLPDTGTDNG